MKSQFTLKSYEFRRERQKTWSRLERLVNEIEKGDISKLRPKDLEDLPQLYRATLSSLSVARSISLDRNVVEYLEALTQRAYFCVYGTKSRLLESIAAFFAQTYPAAVWKHRYAILLSIALVFLGTLVGFQLVKADESRFYTFVDRGLAQERGPQSSREDLAKVLRGTDQEHDSASLAAFSAHLFNHNSGVGMLAFALGFLAGFPTIILLFQTGLMLGAFWALHANRSLSYELWGWLLIHGVTEILAIILCGGAGFVIAQALIFPGRFGRLDNLARRGREAGSIVLGCLVMFLLAGFIEGVLRQTVTNPIIRYSIAASTGAFWIWYFCILGRRASRA